MRIEYNLMPQGQVLQDFNDCRARNSFIMGPLGSGKTVQCILKLFDLMCEQEPVKDEFGNFSNPFKLKFHFLKPKESELKLNKRSRSAKLRSAIKL